MLFLSICNIDLGQPKSGAPVARLGLSRIRLNFEFSFVTLLQGFLHIVWCLVFLSTEMNCFFQSRSQTSGLKNQNIIRGNCENYFDCLIKNCQKLLG